jgi:hypothetical protein
MSHGSRGRQPRPGSLAMSLQFVKAGHRRQKIRRFTGEKLERRGCKRRGRLLDSIHNFWAVLPSGEEGCGESANDADYSELE